MAIVFLGLGSNMDAEKNLRMAVSELRKHYGDLRLSAVYRSTALGFEGADFLNLVAEASTDEDPAELLSYIDTLHEQAGRSRGADRFVSRPLDIDLLLYDDLVDPERPLRLPRPDILEHSFVLRPLAELVPDLVHPTSGRAIGEHWAEFDAGSHPLTRVELIL